jgi:hypothetical protein
MAGLRGEVVYLFAFDVGNEMLTARVESQLARAVSISLPTSNANR